MAPNTSKHGWEDRGDVASPFFNFQLTVVCVEVSKFPALQEIVLDFSSH
jgi:hypothetical protein